MIILKFLQRYLFLLLTFEFKGTLLLLSMTWVSWIIYLTSYVVFMVYLVPMVLSLCHSVSEKVLQRLLPKSEYVIGNVRLHWNNNLNSLILYYCKVFFRIIIVFLFKGSCEFHKVNSTQNVWFEIFNFL